MILHHTSATIQGTVTTIDPAEVERTLSFFCSDLSEIRCLDCATNYGRPFITSGYFDPDHFRDAAVELVKLDRELKPKGCYFVFNSIHPGCHARAYNRFVHRPKSTTTDAEIVQRRWLFIDIDPPRPTGVSATDAEKANAISDREYLFNEVKKIAEPVVCDSGNGWHLYLPLALPNTSESLALVTRILTDLRAKSPLVDTTTSNAARITKLYGTISRKGDSTPERPHRQSKIIHVPDYFHHAGSSLQ